MPEQRRRWPAVAAVYAACFGILLIPGVLWLHHTGNPASYFAGSAATDMPAGQALYVFSKLAGMYALLLIGVQVIMTLLSRRRTLPVRWRGAIHYGFGIALIILSSLHAALFFLAASKRGGSWAIGLLLPNFQDYYHTHVTLGLLGLVVLLMVGFVGSRRRKNPARSLANTHRLYWLAIVLLYFHSLSIGTESQTAVGLVFYGSIGFLLLILFSQQLRSKFKH